MSERSVVASHFNAAELKKRLYDEGKAVCDGCWKLDRDAHRLALEKMVETMETNDCRDILKASKKGDSLANAFVFVCFHRVDILQVFLDNEINVNIQTLHGCTALMMASEGRKIEPVQLLLNCGADVNCRGYGGQTALMDACFYNSVEAAQLLLIHGANADIRDNFGCTALMFASSQGHKDIVDLLLNHGVNADIRDNEGFTALMKASKKDHYDIVQWLLNHGADIELKNNRAQTAKDLATTEIEEMLKNHVTASYVLK